MVCNGDVSTVSQDLSDARQRLEELAEELKDDGRVVHPAIESLDLWERREAIDEEEINDDE